MGNLTCTPYAAVQLEFASVFNEISPFFANAGTDLPANRDLDRQVTFKPVGIKLLRSCANFSISYRWCVI